MLNLKGKIADSLSAQPVEYAIVSIYKLNEAKPLGGKLTDSTGRFLFSDLNAGIYTLKIELIGYRTKNFIILGFEEKGGVTTFVNLFFDTVIDLVYTLIIPPTNNPI